MAIGTAAARPLRICDLTTLYIDGGEGGVNTYLREKASYLSRFPGRFEHSLVVPARQHEVRSLCGSALYGIASPRYLKNPHHRVMFNRRAVAEVLRTVRPDVVEVDCTMPLARLVERTLASRPPVIVGFYHVHLPSCYARPWAAALGGDRLGAVAENLAWRYLRHCTRSCDRVVVSSPHLAGELGEQGLDRVEYVPLGVNLDLFGLEADDARPRAAAGPPTVLFVGRLSAEKDLPLLFRAYDILSKEGEYGLRIVGDGPLRSKVEAWASRRDRVAYLGPCPYGERLASIYRDADVLALPSPNETFGLTVLEALASGTPVVAVRRGGPAELLTPGVGALARPGDAADFAAKIAGVLSGQRSSRFYRNHVVEHYSWDCTFERLVSIYREELAERGGATGSARLPALAEAAAGGG